MHAKTWLSDGSKKSQFNELKVLLELSLGKSVLSEESRSNTSQSRMCQFHAKRVQDKQVLMGHIMIIDLAG